MSLSFKLFGEKAKYFLNNPNVKISSVTKLDSDYDVINIEFDTITGLDAIKSIPDIEDES